MNLIFFSPHSAIWEHAFPELLVLDSLRENGHEITFITCDRTFSQFCNCMACYGLNEFSAQSSKNKVCDECVSNKELIVKKLALKELSLNKQITEKHRITVRGIVNNVTRENFEQLVIDDVEIGKISVYELILQYKKMSTRFSDQEWRSYLISLENTLLSLFGFRDIFHKLNDIDGIFIYSPQYAVNHACASYCENQGVPVYFLEAGTNIFERLNTMRIWKWNSIHLINPMLSRWVQYKDFYFPPSDLKRVTNHFKKLLEGKSYMVYSAPTGKRVSIRERFGIKPDQKILLATLSSYDEAYAAYLIGLFPKEKVYSSVFRTQREWIQATIRLVAQRKDLFLLIRVHPRDFPNKRESQASEQSMVLISELEGLPENARVNWPDDNISLYNIFDEVDVVLTGWSVTALEAAILGLPVVTYDKRVPSYPSDLTFTGTSETEYYRNIDNAIADGWSFQHTIKAYRWLCLNFCYNTVTIARDFENSISDFSLKKRILRLVTSKICKLFWRKQDISSRDCSLPGFKFINQLLVQGKDALIDIDEFKPAFSLDMKSGEKFLREELRELFNLLYGASVGQMKRGTLGHKIMSFLESRQ